MFIKKPRKYKKHSFYSTRDTPTQAEYDMQVQNDSNLNFRGDSNSLNL